MDVMKPNKQDNKKSFPDIILRWILSNIKGTPKHLQKKMEKWIKY